MTTRKQRTAAKRNIEKAARAARRKRTIAHLPKKTRTALGKQGAKRAKKNGRVQSEISLSLVLIWGSPLAFRRSTFGHLSFRLCGNLIYFAFSRDLARPFSSTFV